MYGGVREYTEQKGTYTKYSGCETPLITPVSAVIFHKQVYKYRKCDLTRPLAKKKIGPPHWSGIFTQCHLMVSLPDCLLSSFAITYT